MLVSTLITASTLVSGISAASVSSTPAQTFTGIGGSSAWWPNDLINFPVAVRQNISDLLWSSSGLALSSYRWNLGGGGLGVSNKQRAIGTFYLSAGNYNWTADPGGRYFVEAAVARQVPQITAFVNSGPYTFTTNGLSCGGLFKTGTEAAYGKYIADVLSYFKSNVGVHVNYVSPFNEPDSSFGPTPCGQEGMETDANQRAAVINGLYSALQTAGLTDVGIMADETSQLPTAVKEYLTWLPQVVSKVAVICHHTYDFPTDATYQSYINSVASVAPGKKTWMSEICCSVGAADGTGKGYSQGYDPTIRGALHFSSMMFQSFLVANEPHYDFWTLASSEIGCSPLGNSACVTSINTAGWNDGLIYYDPSYATNGNYALYLTKHYWTMKHFGNYVRPGAVRYPVTGTTTPILVATYQSGFAVILLNAYTSTLTIALDLSAVPNGANLKPTTAYRTSATEDFANLSTLPTKMTNGSWTLSSTSTSLTTWIFA